MHWELEKDERKQKEDKSNDQKQEKERQIMTSQLRNKIINE